MGSSGFGFGSPVTATPRSPRVLVCADGTQGNAALLDPRSGDFVLDGAGNKAGCDAIEQKVYLALRTIRGSSVVPDLGIEPEGGVLLEDFVARRRLAVEAALKDLTTSRSIVLVDVLVAREGQSSTRTEVRWRKTTEQSVRSVFV